MKVNVAVVEDDEDLRVALEGMLNRSGDYSCAGTFTNGEDALKEIPRMHPGIVLVDLKLPGISGCECTRRLMREIPDLKVVIITGFLDSGTLFLALRAGASGYLQKPFTMSECMDAMRTVEHDGAALCGEAARILVDWLREPRADRYSLGLTAREEEIMELLQQGRTNKELAAFFQVSGATIHNHLQHIYEKLAVHSRGEAVACFLGLQTHERDGASGNGGTASVRHVHGPDEQARRGVLPSRWQ